MEAMKKILTILFVLAAFSAQAQMTIPDFQQELYDSIINNSGRNNISPSNVGMRLYELSEIVQSINGGGGSSPVTSVFGRTGDITAHTGDYTASQIFTVGPGILNVGNVLFIDSSKFVSVFAFSDSLTGFLRKSDSTHYLTPAAFNAGLSSYYTKMQSDGRYLQSFTESDPVFGASAAYGISSTNLNHWNTAYNKYVTGLGFSNGVLTLTLNDASTETASLPGGNSGTVTNFSAENITGFASATVASATTTPALSFSLNNAPAHEFWGNNTGSTTAPAYVALGIDDLPAIPFNYLSSVPTTKSGYGITDMPSYPDTAHGTKPFETQSDANIKIAAVAADIPTDNNQLTNGAGYQTTNSAINMTGAVEGTGTTTINATLTPVGVTAGSYGDATHYVVITVNAAGQVTAVTTYSVSAGGGSTPTLNQVLTAGATSSLTPTVAGLDVTTGSGIGFQFYPWPSDNTAYALYNNNYTPGANNSNAVFEAGENIFNVNSYFREFNTNTRVFDIDYGDGNHSYIDFIAGASGTTDNGVDILQAYGSTYTQGLKCAGNISLNNAGNRLIIKTGTNAALNSVNLSSGTVTVSNTTVTSNSVIRVWYTGAVSTTSSTLTVSSQTPGTGFTITALTAGTATTNTADNNNVTYEIIDKQ